MVSRQIITRFSPNRRERDRKATDKSELLMASGGGPRIIHIYVCTSYPSYSETFVATEMEMLEEMGDTMAVYSLRKPPSGLAKHCPYVSRPKGRLGLLPWLVPGVAITMRSIVGGLRFKIESTPRLLYAGAHAARLRLALRRIQRKLNPNEYLVLHAHFFDRPADVVAMVGGIRAVKLVTAHAGDARDSSDPKLRVWRLSVFDRVICASKHVRKELVQSTRSCATAVIHCGVRPVPNVEIANRPSFGKEIRFCTVARLIEKKGHRYASMVLAALARQGHPIRWDIVGEGPVRKYLEELKREWRGIIPLEIHGALPHPTALKITALSQFSILPSSPKPPGPDGIPVALIESMAAGVPAISTAVGGIPELIINERTGILGDPEDPLTCAEKIAAVIQNKGRWEELSELGRDHVSSDFDAGGAATALRDVVKECLEEQSLTDSR